jgi:hydroxyacylglutathione hydrolase
MLFERFEVPGLVHYSYAVGCPGSGEVAVVDPERDISRYLRFAESKKLRITHVLETHIHADYASGARDLAERTGAALHLSAHDTDEKFEVGFDHEEMSDGGSVTLGNVRIEALHTPGHTPEHLSFLVWDLSRSEDVPQLLLSGDFLLVGSLGRPDLLGDEASRDLARRLHESVRDKLGPLPDGLEIHPAHGAGSLCGGGVAGRPMSTLGYERATNPYLDPELSADELTDKILAEAPPRPPYYTKMKVLNSAGPDRWDAGAPEELGVEGFADHLDGGAVVIDLRDQLAFGGGHIEGSFGIGAGDNFVVWAPWVVPYDRPLLLVAPATEAGEVDLDAAAEARRLLARVGLDRVEGVLDGGLATWRASGHPLTSLPQLTPPELAERLEGDDGLRVLDVRGDDEYESGHIPGAHHVYLGYVEDDERNGDLPDGPGPVAVVCGSGYRSTVGASTLARRGYDVINVTGGMTGWKAADLPTESGSAGSDDES